MTDRDRLIELVDKAKKEYAGDVTDHTETDYIVECLLNNGVIVPPCKVGDVVYPLNADPRFRAFIDNITQTKNGLEFEWVQYDVGVDCTEIWDAECFEINDIGKTVFLNETEYLKAKGILTKEEAEAKLKELGK